MADIANQSEHSASVLPGDSEFFSLVLEPAGLISLTGLAREHKQIGFCFLAQSLHGTDGDEREDTVTSLLGLGSFDRFLSLFGVCVH